MMGILLALSYGPKNSSQVAAEFNTNTLREIQLDIDPSVAPDATSTMTEMGAATSAAVRAIISSHHIEQVYPLEVPIAFMNSYFLSPMLGFRLLRG
jgi:hypothetical protein